MTPRYTPDRIESKWADRWERDGLYRTAPADGRPKRYVLDFFPYPSGDGLSVGHCRNYVPTDVLSRYYRMQGENVLHPMGWDAFGLPAENAAIRLKTNPAGLIARFAANYKRQMRLLGISFDWSREINSSQPEYYRWTQWVFLQLYHSWYDPRLQKACPISGLEEELARRGSDGIPGAPAITAEAWRQLPAAGRKDYLSRFRLAYREASSVNWDPVEKTVLANEEVVDGRGWRSGALVEKKRLMQWFFRITAYADRLLADLEGLDWPESIKLMQRNWIGRSRGAEVSFATAAGPLTVFTTRPDTLWGATFMVLAPEHPLVFRPYRALIGSRGRVLSSAGPGQERSGSDGPGAGQDGCVPGIPRHQSGQRRSHPHLGGGLCPDGVWNRRHHGGPGPRPARLRVRPPARPGDPGGDPTGGPG